MYLMENLPAVLLAVAGLATLVILIAVWAGRGSTGRYVIAMVIALVAAFLATLFAASPIASYVTSRMVFDSPDGVEAIHGVVWIGVGMLALVVGWTIGWWLSGGVVRRRQTI